MSPFKQKTVKNSVLGQNLLIIIFYFDHHHQPIIVKILFIRDQVQSIKTKNDSTYFIDIFYWFIRDEHKFSIK